MKKVKPTSTEKCSYCKERAVWKSTGLSFIQFACAKHKQALDTQEVINRDDGYMPEGDYQSWGRL